MNRLRFSASLALATIAFAGALVGTAAANPPAPGTSRAEVVATLGRPMGAARQGNRETLLYSDGRSVLLEDGRVVSAQGFASPRETGPAPEPVPPAKPTPRPRMRPSSPPRTVRPPSAEPSVPAREPAIGPHTVWFQSAQIGDTQTVAVLMKEIGIDFRDEDGNTVLHHAVAGRPRAMAHPGTDTIRFLLNVGADKDATNRWGRTPLQLAAMLHRPNEEKQLLLAGARTDMAGRDQRTYADILRERRQWVHRDNRYSLAVAFGNNMFVAVGEGIVTSLDGVRWTRRRKSERPGFRSVDFLDGFFYVGTARGDVLRSADGIEWARIRPLEKGAFANPIAEIAGHSHVLIARERPGGLLRAINLYQWERVRARIPRTISGLVWTGSRFAIADARGAMFVSADGETWTPGASPAWNADRLLRMRFLNNEFFVMGREGTMLRSADGTVFTECRVELDTDIADAAYGAGRYVAVGSRGALLFSADGAAWHGQHIRREQTVGGDLMAVAYGNNAFVAAGRNGLWSRHGD